MNNPKWTGPIPQSPCHQQPTIVKTIPMYGDYTCEEYWVFICPVCGQRFYAVNEKAKQKVMAETMEQKYGR